MEPAWKDIDDQNIHIDTTSENRLKKLSKDQQELTGTEYTQKLRDLYSQMHHTSWLSSTASDSSAISKLLKTAKPILSNKTPHLLPTILDISQLPHANAQNYSKSCINALEFQGTTLLSAGKDKRLRIFNVDGVDNPLQAVVYMKDLPISSAHFCDTSIYLSGSRPYFYEYDVPTERLHRISHIIGYEKEQLGKMAVSPDNRFVVFLGVNGKVMFISTSSNKLLFEFKMNQDGHALTFLDENTLLTGGDEGEIYLWDISMRRCIRRFCDEGSTKITCMSTCGDYLATGSTNGVVNLYNTKNDDFSLPSPPPIKSVMNLTTAIDGVTFNHNAEILAMYSRWKRDAVKLLHVPSQTVFSNWPGIRDHIKYPMSLAFSSNSELMSVGNDEGVALLYRLNHYAN
ncbi:unnamed protein product [Blepharisma stoltei]|uniref:U3 small nucleolar RNA-associated protein 18 homolog n=1 Tax=Blepharisma stoltei TaxID=1481888 RepID=A0AAU9K121_9CILI|nr:unnamed protein product [Blepharisma stoltei]